MNTEKRLYQWDTGQQLTGCTGLYVDFPIGDEVYRVKTADGTCIIPDELLQTSGGHKVYECMTNNTIRSFAFSVTPRPKPPDYVYTPTERLTFEGLVQKVDDAVADMIRRAESGEFDGHTPVKGTDYFTASEIQQIQNEVSSGAIGEFKSVVDTETETFNNNAKTKLNAYNQNDSQKTNTYNTNATEKLNAYNSNAGAKLSAYNTNASNKVTEYNSNAENKTAEFDTHTEHIQTDISKLKSDLSDIEENIKIEYGGTKYFQRSVLTDESLNVTLRSKKVLTDIAIGNVTYGELFGEAYNAVKTNFNSGTYSPSVLNSGNPIISDESFCTKPYSLKAFGSTSQQIYEVFDLTAGYYYFASKVKVDRYVQGWAGAIFINTNNPAYIQRTTNGFETAARIVLIEPGGADFALFMGTGSSADIDAYVDDVVFINITDLFENLDTQEGRVYASNVMGSLYDEYCDIINNDIQKSFSIDISSNGKGGKYAGIVLDANSSSERFTAMKELYDIAEKVKADQTYVPSASEFTSATKGIVCELPSESTAFYENYPLNILYSKNADEQTLPASTTKVVSLVTAMPYITSVMEKVTLTSDDIQAGSGNFFSAGDVMTIEDLMLGMMLPSSNTCAMAFAHHIGKKILGNDSASYSDCISAFVSEMNRKASILGCSNSAFDTPSGLSKTNKTTASDLLKFLIEACSYNEILRVWNKKTYTIKVGGTNARDVELETTVTDANLETDYYVFGGKTGSLDYGDGTVARALVMVAESK